MADREAIIKANRVFYDVWELHDVTDHLLVVPKRHVHSLSELDEEGAVHEDVGSPFRDAPVVREPAGKDVLPPRLGGE